MFLNFWPFVALVSYRLVSYKKNECNCVIKREHTIKCLGVLIDENLTWKTHINNNESKISKSLGMRYKAKFMLNQNCLKSIHFSFIHCHLSYENIVWASTNPRKLKKIK